MTYSVERRGLQSERNRAGFNMWGAGQLLLWGPLCKIPKAKRLTMKHI